MGSRSVCNRMHAISFFVSAAEPAAPQTRNAAHSPRHGQGRHLDVGAASIERDLGRRRRLQRTASNFTDGRSCAPRLLQGHARSVKSLCGVRHQAGRNIPGYQRGPAWLGTEPAGATKLPWAAVAARERAVAGAGRHEWGDGRGEGGGGRRVLGASAAWTAPSTGILYRPPRAPHTLCSSAHLRRRGAGHPRCCP